MTAAHRVEHSSGFALRVVFWWLLIGEDANTESGKADFAATQVGLFLQRQFGTLLHVIPDAADANVISCCAFHPCQTKSMRAATMVRLAGVL